MRGELEKILPDAQITDFRETSPALSEGLDHATGLLSLICLVAMVLGAIGVGMAMRAHLQQRIDILAIMKSIGARSSDILRIYLLQTLLLGRSGRVDWYCAWSGCGMGAPVFLRQAVAYPAAIAAAGAVGICGVWNRNSYYHTLLSSTSARCSEDSTKHRVAQSCGRW